MGQKPRARTYDAFGAYVMSQRQLAHLSLRQAAALARISNPYLSQIEHGLALPSITVINALAEALDVSAETLLRLAAGLAAGDATERSTVTEDAIRRDPRLDDAQKHALLAVLTTFVDPSSPAKPTHAGDDAATAVAEHHAGGNRRRPQPRTERSMTMPDMRFDGQVCIITGAGGGLGRSHALELARRGGKILVNDLGGSVDGSGASSSAAQRVVDEITAFGGQAAANHDSVATPEGGQAIVQAALTAFGRVDVLVNNAGILRDKAFHKMDQARIDTVIDVHLKGAFYVSQPAFRLMREQGYGRIVNTSSASGLFGNFGQANYGAAKAGLAGLTRVLALEGAGHGIKVNAIAPIASTRMTADILGELAAQVSPESVSPIVAYLAHQDCSVNGNIYSVAGGRVARIVVVETPGVVLPAVTAESFRDHVSDIEQPGERGYLQPASLDDETTIIAKALAEAS